MASGLVVKMFWLKDIACIIILVLSLLSQHLLQAQSHLFTTIYSTVTIPENEICKRMHGLTDKLKEMCAKKPDEIVAVAEGMQMSADECAFQFRSQRWNCSSLGNDSLFSRNRAIVGTREAAFTSAIWAAGIAHAVTRACSMGNLTTRCGCDRSREGQRSPSGWTWGCSADIRYGINESRSVYNAQEIAKDASALMNKHNAEAGLKVLRDSMQLECKCHGASASCSVKTCWLSLSSFRVVGNIIKQKYDSAVKAVPYEVPTPKGKEAILLTQEKPANQKPSEKVLVFLKDSPNYCSRDISKGMLGTVGRICNNTSVSFDSCKSMCCGRGYNTHQFMKEWQCNCKFHWCCVVKCKTCSDRITQHTCK